MNTRNHNKRLYGAVVLGLSLTLGASSTALADTHAQFMQAAQKQFSARQDDAAYTDAAKARQLAANPGEVVEADLLLAQILTRQKKNAEAIKLLQNVVSQDGLEPVTEARARVALAGALFADRQYDQAKSAAEPVLEMNVPTAYLHQAQREVLRGTWGFSNWLTRGNVEALEETVRSIMAQEKEAWPDRNIRVLSEAARLFKSSSCNPQVREMYELLLKQESLNTAGKLSAYRGIASAQLSEATYDKAYDTLKEAFKLEGLTATDRLNLHMDRVDLARVQDDYPKVLEHLNEAMKVASITPAQRKEVQAQFVSVYLSTQDMAKARTAAKELMQGEGALTNAQARLILRVSDTADDLRQYQLAQELTAQLVGMKLSSVVMAEALGKLAVTRLSLQDISGAREALEKLAGLEQEKNARTLTRHLQLAASQEQGMQQRIVQVLGEYEGLPAQEKIRALWDAAKPFFQARHDAPARALIAQADEFGIHAVKTYRVQAVERAPVDVGSWQASGLLARPGVADARFYPYSQQDAAAMFAVDVRTERPFGDVATQGSGPGETRVAMVYDAQGWHIFVHSQEPRIEQIVSRNGEGANSLEMFFTPGTYNEPYYQWITNLGTNKTSIYDWNSPHKSYRTLAKKGHYFRINSQAIEDGWGTSIFISWEAFYDQMAMLDGKEQVWRFSMQRWNPAGSVTWGGRVHEMGRWGHIIFEAPSEELRMAIKRNLLKKSWAHYQAALTQQSTYWSGLRGDKDFFEQVITPMVEHSRTLASVMADIDKLDAQQLNEVFAKNIALMQEVMYDISEKRQDFLRHRLLSSR